jgi:hypothetical protein
VLAGLVDNLYVDLMHHRHRRGTAQQGERREGMAAALDVRRNQNALLRIGRFRMVKSTEGRDNEDCEPDALDPWESST